MSSASVLKIGAYSWSNLHKGKPDKGAMPLSSWVQTRDDAPKTKKLKRLPDASSSKQPKQRQDKIDRHMLTIGAVSKDVKWHRVLSSANTKVLLKDYVWFDQEALDNPVPDQRGRKAEKRPNKMIDRVEEVLDEVYESAMPRTNAKKKKSPPTDNSVGFSRRVFYQTKHWDGDFLRWFVGEGTADWGFVRLLEDSLITLEHGPALLGKVTRYASRGQCSRCRRMTTGYSSATKRDKSNGRLSNYAIYNCDCKSKHVNHCTRCVLLEYLVEARRIYGDFLIRDEAGRITGFQEIPCLNKCGKDWSPATLLLVGPPKDRKPVAAAKPTPDAIIRRRK